MKIISFVTHTTEINRILRGIGWSVDVPIMEPPYDEWDICQLVGTDDGFPEEVVAYTDTGPDPPNFEEAVFEYVT